LQFNILNAIESWVRPFHDGIMTTKVSPDKAGRFVFPKPLRDQMQLVSGDILQLESEGECITMRPVRPKTALKKECGIWIYHGELTDTSIPDLLDRERDKRLSASRECRSFSTTLY